MPDRSVVVAATVALLALTTAGCSATATSSGTEDVTAVDESGASMVTSLCRLQHSTDGDAVRDGFGRLHGRLHDLAADVAEVDRELAGRLHVAKQATEVALDGDPTTLRLRAVGLVEVVRESLRALGRDDGTCRAPA